MIGITAKPAQKGAASGLWGAVRGIGRIVADTYRMGFRALWLAPWLIAIAVVPEALQHVAEIKIGMFESREAFRSLADDPQRWAFGYAKVAGFVLAILAVARFQALGSARRAVLIGPRNLLRLAFAIGLTVAADLPFGWLEDMSGSAAVDVALKIISALIQIGLMVYLVAALIDDRALGLREAVTERYPTGLLIALVGACAFVPAQALHTGNHLLALGQPGAIVWAVMAFDSLVVGALASLIGTAFYCAYRAGPTWRGWTARPSGARTAEQGPRDSL